MSQHDVFNPQRGLDPQLGFNANWNYGSPRKMGANLLIQRPRLGAWSTREITSAGYTFTLTFAGRPIEQVRYIQRFYHQFKFGFFTLIDHDNGAREHVGRFTSYSDDTQTANLKYTVRVTFEEVPQAPMRNYPSDWAHQSHWQPSVDDFGNLLAASNNPAVIAQTVPGLTGPLPHPQEMYLAAPAVGDFIQTQYVGWGFRLSLRVSANLGYCNLFVDGVELVSYIDPALASESSSPAPGPGPIHPLGIHGAPIQIGGPIVTPIVTGGGAGTNVPISILVQGLPLDAHLVQLVAAGGGSATGSDLLFPAIEVMH